MLLNLTPHDIIVRVEGIDRVYPASGRVARVSVSTVPVGTVDGIPLFRSVKGAVEGLEFDADGIVIPCLVSGMVLDALNGATANIFAPATGPKDGAIRSDKGHIVAVVALIGG